MNVDSGFSSAHDDFFTGSPDGYKIGGEFSIPLGNRTAKAQVTKAEIELRRAKTELRREEQNIILAVRRAVRALEDTLERLDAAERRREAQQETLAAEQERLRLGDSTPFTVLEFEEDLADAERQEITSLQLYRVAITELERNQATLLETRGINLEHELDR